MRCLGFLLVTLLAASAPAREPSFEEYSVLHDSFLMQPPRMRSRWLNERGLEMPGWNTPLTPTDFPDSSGLRLVGKWGRGAAYEVTVRDTILFLALGSEVAIISIADPNSPIVLSEPQAMGVVRQAAVRDSFLYVGSAWGLTGMEVWNIADPANPVLRSRTRTLLDDFCVRDTFLYLCMDKNQATDSFKVYSVADPENVYLLGASRDSGSVITVSNNTAVLGQRWGLHAIDVTDPTSPHHVGSFPGSHLGLDSRGGICAATAYWTTDEGHFRFELLDISDPASIRRIGSLNEIGGYDVHLVDSLAFISGFSTREFLFSVVDISDSTRPRLISECPTPGDRCGVWADWPSDWAYVADRFAGLTVLDISNINAPSVDTSLIGSGVPRDVDVRDSLMFVATSSHGLQIVSVANPSRPVQLYSGYKLGEEAVAIGDSFAYVDTFAIDDLCVLDIRNPRNPVRVGGGVDLFNPYEDLVLQDSFLYVAEAYRFEVVNVARPREAELVGTCNLYGFSGRMDLQDSIAYVTNTRFSLVSVADPSNPVVTSTYPARMHGVDAVDTVMYGTAPYTGLIALSVADPSRPYALDSLHLTDTLWWNDVVVVDSLAYVGGERIWVVDVSNPRDLRLVPGASSRPPGLIERMEYRDPYLYAAMWDAGVAIYEACSLGVAEQEPVEVERREGPTVMRASEIRALGMTVLDCTGRDVTDKRRSLPPGVYFLRQASGVGHPASTKIVLTR